MSMTKKDYEAIARAIERTTHHNAVDSNYNEGWHGAITAIRCRLADVMADDNPRFDRQRFLKACGVTD